MNSRTLNCPTGSSQAKSQILFHKKSPAKDFIEITLVTTCPLCTLCSEGVDILLFFSQHAEGAYYTLDNFPQIRPFQINQIQEQQKSLLIGTFFDKRHSETNTEGHPFIRINCPATHFIATCMTKNDIQFLAKTQILYQFTNMR